ncbi:[F-actin]-monooxygenase MICAL3, partial [Camelus dromedarius]
TLLLACLAGSSVNGLEEPSVAKRLRGTPERIELENYRLSVRQAEGLQEVPEETQAEHNLSSVLDTGTEEDVASSSSESEMEEEEEEEEEAPLPTSDLGGVPWKEAVRIHALLKGKSEEELEASGSFEPGDEEEEEEDEDEEDEEEEDEEEEESSEAGSQRLQQNTSPADPLEIQADVHWTHIRENKEQVVPASESSPSGVPDLPCVRRAAVQAWLEAVSGGSSPGALGNHCRFPTCQVSVCPSPSLPPLERFCLAAPFDEEELEEDADSEPAEREGEAVENGDTGDTGAELDDDQHWSDDAPSLSEAGTELQVQHQVATGAGLELRVSEGGEETPPATAGRGERGPSHVSSPIWPPEEQAALPSPAHSPGAQRQGDTEDTLGSPLAGDEALRRSDLVAEFWMKSAEIRRSLGLTPVCRGPTPTLQPVSPKVYTAEKSSQGEGLHLLKPPPIPTPGSPPERELTITLTRPHREPTQPHREEVRKSFVESVDEIPFADDVEDTYDDRTEDSSLQETFFTPPSCWALPEKPPQLPQAKENGRGPPVESGAQPQKRGLPLVSAEAKELATQRMRAREKSVRSQALRDAMARQLSRMKEDTVATTPKNPRAPASLGTAAGPSQGRGPGPQGPAEPTLRHEAVSEEVPCPPSDSGGPDGSVTSSEGSSGKSKKRSSLFSPRRNKKEKKPKGEGQPPERPSPSPLEEGAAKPRSLWKSVFSGYRRDRKKKGDDRSCSSTPSSGATVDTSQPRASPVVRAELQSRHQRSCSEDSDLSSDDILERASQKSRREPRTYTEEELNAKLTRRVQKAARRQAKQEELKRLHRAQIIQRQLEQVEEKQRQLEERGVAVEKALRGEAGTAWVLEKRDAERDLAWWRSRSPSLQITPAQVEGAGMGKKDDPKLMQEWFTLVQEKNALVRYESELMIFARELELEDRQSRLQQELRERMAVEDHLKTEEELSEEKRILNEMLEVVEQRDALVALLEEQRLREKEEDKDLEAAMLSKGFSLNWS